MLLRKDKRMPAAKKRKKKDIVSGSDELVEITSEQEPVTAEEQIDIDESSQDDTVEDYAPIEVIRESEPMVEVTQIQAEQSAPVKAVPVDDLRKLIDELKSDQASAVMDHERWAEDTTTRWGAANEVYNKVIAKVEALIW